MSKPGVDPTSGISSGDVLILPERHPACRRRETQLGFRMERENLAGDGKGKAQAATTARPKVPMHRRGAHCPLVVMKWGNARGAVQGGAGLDGVGLRVILADLSDNERATNLVDRPPRSLYA